ncbi:efflux RND transporter periplasmic adaptor subunit [Massilia sp. TWP1-3-3]|uniref:efflux RND transporter periplasmic adaptor subunit n=1 Tax=Massilia sp. TWP1-3-3 TaxID=2804573 RepID=UPI003CEFF147
MKKYTLSFIGALAMLCAALPAQASPGAHGPNGEHLDAQLVSSGSGLARLPDGSVNVPKLAQRRMTIRTLMVQESDVPQTVELNGRTSIDPNAGGRVQAPFAGRIEGGAAGIPTAGTAVRKGQVLLVLRPVAPAFERGNQQAQLAEARAQRTLLEQRVKRLVALEGVVPAKDIDAARAELAGTMGRERAVANAVNGREEIVASASGVIASANVLNGQIVEARDVLFEIVDPERMMVEAQVTDPQIAGSIVGAHLAGLPGVELTLAGLSRTLRDGALPISFRAKGKALPLAVGQSVTVIARLRASVRGVALPAAALARNPANQTIVWIKSGAQRFIALPVEASAINATTVVVTKGLSGENRVVVLGASLINQIR